jgi:hypothetical protein
MRIDVRIGCNKMATSTTATHGINKSLKLGQALDQEQNYSSKEGLLRLYSEGP